MKKIIITLATLSLFVGLSSCESDKQLHNEIRGVWYDEYAEMLLAFEDDSYFIYTLSTNIEIDGTYEVDKDTILLQPEDGFHDMTWTDVKVKDEVLSFVSESGKKLEWTKVDKNKFEEICEEYDID